MAHSHRYSKRTESTSSKASNGEHGQREDDNPNMIVYKKVRSLPFVIWHLVTVKIDVNPS